LTGPHPRSRRGSVYIVTCIDPFTKWAEAFAAPNKEAATVARIIVEQIICRFGCPIAILSDQGKEVDGNLMAEICRILDIDKQHTSTYKPSTSAAVERLHRTLNSIMGKLVESHISVYRMLLFVMAAYRSSRHEATNYTPNFLLLGREVRAPVDVACQKRSFQLTMMTMQRRWKTECARHTLLYDRICSELLNGQRDTMICE